MILKRVKQLTRDFDIVTYRDNPTPVCSCLLLKLKLSQLIYSSLSIVHVSTENMKYFVGLVSRINFISEGHEPGIVYHIFKGQPMYRLKDKLPIILSIKPKTFGFGLYKSLTVGDIHVKIKLSEYNDYLSPCVLDGVHGSDTHVRLEVAYPSRCLDIF